MDGGSDVGLMVVLALRVVQSIVPVRFVGETTAQQTCRNWRLTRDSRDNRALCEFPTAGTEH